MIRPAQIAVVSLVLAASNIARADSVRLVFRTFDCVACSNEETEVRISRPDPAEPAGHQRVDDYFRVVEEALSSGKVSAKWNPGLPIHADTLLVEITLGARHYKWTVAWDRVKISATSGESTIDRQHRLAIDAVIAASLQHLKLQATTKEYAE